MKIASNAIALNTPLVELLQTGREIPVKILGKLETRNPQGNVKDRIAWAMARDVKEHGFLEPGSTVREYRLVLTMPETMSEERRGILRALKEEPVLTPGKGGMRGTGFVPRGLSRSVIHEVLTVTGEEATDTSRKLAREEGILARIPSREALAAALRVARRPESAGRT